MLPANYRGVEKTALAKREDIFSRIKIFNAVRVPAKAHLAVPYFKT
jgi:hypothetical protein